MIDSPIELLIKNQKGLHARAAAAFVKCVSEYDAEVIVEKDGQSVDGSSILGLMMLSASKGCTIKVSATGTDSMVVLERLTDLVDSLFGEEQ